VCVRQEMEAGRFGFRELRALLEGRARDHRAMFVGHEPDLSQLVGRLIGGANVDVKKGALICVEADVAEPGRGVLLWSMTPKILMAIREP